MLNENQKKQLELAVAALDRQYGKGTVIKLDSDAVEPWPSVPTGALTLDNALGIGGLPLGRVVEIYGEAGTGKSTLALSVVAEAQAKDMACIYIDAEHALDPVYMKAVGVNLDDLYLSQPDSGEQALDVVQKMVASHAVGVIVIDSVSTLVPQVELDGNIGDSHMGTQARMMSQALRILNPAIAKSSTMVVFINQFRDKMVPYGDPRTTSGGRALKFYSSVRLEVSKASDMKGKNGDISGIRSKVKVVKNKLAPALKVAEFDIVFGKGIDKVGCVVDVAEARGFLIRKGAWYSDPETGENLSQGRDNLITYLKEDDAFLSSLIKKLNENV
jgi:recombination protein RecA